MKKRGVFLIFIGIILLIGLLSFVESVSAEKCVFVEAGGAAGRFFSTLQNSNTACFDSMQDFTSSFDEEDFLNYLREENPSDFGIVNSIYNVRTILNFREYDNCSCEELVFRCPTDKEIEKYGDDRYDLEVPEECLNGANEYIKRDEYFSDRPLGVNYCLSEGDLLYYSSVDNPSLPDREDVSWGYDEEVGRGKKKVGTRFGNINLCEEATNLEASVLPSRGASGVCSFYETQEECENKWVIYRADSDLLGSSEPTGNYKEPWEEILMNCRWFEEPEREVTRNTGLFGGGEEYTEIVGGDYCSNGIHPNFNNNYANLGEENIDLNGDGNIDFKANVIKQGYGEIKQIPQKIVAHMFAEFEECPEYNDVLLGAEESESCLEKSRLDKRLEIRMKNPVVPRSYSSIPREERINTEIVSYLYPQDKDLGCYVFKDELEYPEEGNEQPIDSAGITVFYSDNEEIVDEISIEESGMVLDCEDSDKYLYDYRSLKSVCKYVFNGTVKDRVYEALDSDNRDKKLFCNIKDSSGQTYVSTPVKILRNIKNEDFYANKPVFLVGDEDWRQVVQAIPATVWKKDERHEDWCNELETQNATGDLIPSGKCGYPLITYHREGDNIGPGVSDSSFGNYFSNNELGDTIADFVRDYQPFKIVSVKQDENDNVAEDVARDVAGLNFVSTGTVDRDWYKDAWKEYGLVVVTVESDYYNNSEYSDILFSSDSVYASLIAAYYNAPLIYLNDEDWENGLREELKNKLAIMVGGRFTYYNNHVSVYSKISEENFQEFFDQNYILGNVKEWISFGEEIDKDNDGAKDPMLLGSYPRGDVDSGRGLGYPAWISWFLHEDLGEETPRREVVVNPSDIYPNFCESEFFDGNEFSELYCKHSLLGPYLAFVTNSRFKFLNNGAYSPGVLEKEDIKNDLATEYEGDEINFDRIDELEEQLSVWQEDSLNNAGVAKKWIGYSNQNFYYPGECPAYDCKYECRALGYNSYDVSENSVLTGGDCFDSPGSCSGSDAEEVYVSSCTEVVDSTTENDWICACYDSPEKPIYPKMFPYVSTLVAEQKAIPYGDEQFISINGQLIYNSLDRYYSDRNGDGFRSEKEPIVNRVRGKSPTDGFLGVNRELFNVGCGEEQAMSCPINIP